MKVAKKKPTAQLVIVGDGTAKPKLETIVEKAGISEQVHFLGRVIGDDLPQIYRTGSVFAITSKTETQSIVLMEAMASGLPCVAVKAGAVHELVKNNKNGFLANPDDVNGVARSILKILDNSKLRERMSKESVARAERHDISYTLTRMEEIYRKVLANREREL